MATKIAALWLAFYFLASIPRISGYCPPLTKGWHDLDDSKLDYFTVNSQADADQLKTCYTFKGALFISGHNATGALIIDGPQRIEGELTMKLISGPHNPLFTSVSMTSLASVTGTISIRTRWDGFFTYPEPLKPPRYNLGVLDFPVLKDISIFTVMCLESVHTFNLPSLEHATWLWFSNVPELHTINAPKLTKLGWLQLWTLPSLTKAPSFFTNQFKGSMGLIEISRTGLTDVVFPHIKVLESLAITQNRNLTTINLPAAITVHESVGVGRRGGHISVDYNNPNLHLSLPKLKTVQGSVFLSHLRDVDISELRTIGYKPVYGAFPAGLLVGAGTGVDWWSVKCTNCHSVHFTSFHAPKLRSVEGRIQFDTSPELRSIFFPALKSAMEFMTNNTAAMALENGISMPSFRHVEHVQILGTDSGCEFWESLYCRGGVKGNYSCGRVEVWDPSQSKQFKKWPSFPPDCTGNKLLPLPKEEIDMTERLDWLSGLVFLDCHSKYMQGCVPGRTLKTGFIVILILFVVSTTILWCIGKRKLRQKCWQNAEKGSTKKEVTE